MRKLLLASVATLAGTFAVSGAAHAQAAKAPAPGTVVVHLNGNFTFAMAAVGYQNSGTTKYSSMNTVGLFRLYPGFDATTEGGLQYGVSGELREMSDSTAGAGVSGSSGSAVGLYVRRAYGYVGTKDAGFLRFGQGDGAFTLMSYGDIESFGDGQQWNSDGSLGSITSTGKPSNLFAATGALYTTSKVVYLSPSYAGVNFAVSFEPNSNGLYQGTGGASAESAISGSSPSRRKNTIDAMVGYTGEAAGAKFKVSGGYIESAPLGNTAGAQMYKNLGVAQVGGQVEYAGAALGVNYKFGAENGNFGFKTVGQRNDSDILFSGTYTMGPVLVGASYFFNQNAGAYSVGGTHARTATNDGLAVGADYNLAKNFTVFTQYLYGQTHQKTTTTKGDAHVNAVD
ncbi:MAG: hypothetical protein B7X08_02680, partial [Acidocella sp. 20-63-7]